MPDTPAPMIPLQRTFFTPRTKFALGAAVLVVALAYLVYTAFPGNAHYYLTIGELSATGQKADTKTVRVNGKLVPDTFKRTTDGKEVTFTLTDGQLQLHATYDGVVPDLFFNPHSEVVLEGKRNGDGVFLTDQVIVKCPTKYQAVEYDVPEDAKTVS